jgi:hypothetical protein
VVIVRKHADLVPADRRSQRRAFLQPVHQV